MVKRLFNVLKVHESLLLFAANLQMSDMCLWFCRVAVPFAWAASRGSLEVTTSDAPSAGYVTDYELSYQVTFTVLHS